MPWPRIFESAIVGGCAGVTSRLVINISGSEGLARHKWIRPGGLFWSGEALEEKRLPNFVTPYSKDLIDCAAYTLTIGHEVYVSPERHTAHPQNTTLRRSANGEAFSPSLLGISFLLTEEIVTVPAYAVAFISIRAKIRFRGLINVSGFHVDPRVSWPARLFSLQRWPGYNSFAPGAADLLDLVRQSRSDVVEN